MSTCGKSDYADLLGIDMPVCCVVADGADGALCVDEGDGVSVGGVAIF